MVLGKKMPVIFKRKRNVKGKKKGSNRNVQIMQYEHLGANVSATEAMELNSQMHPLQQPTQDAYAPTRYDMEDASQEASSELYVLRTKLASVRAENADLNSQLGRIASADRAEAGSLKRQVSQLEDQCMMLVAEIGTLARTMKNNRLQISAQNDEIMALNQDKDALRRETDVLQQQNTSFKRENGALQRDNEALDMANQQLQELLHSTQIQNQNQLEESSRLREQNQALQARLKIACLMIDRGLSDEYYNAVHSLEAREAMDGNFHQQKERLQRENNNLRAILQAEKDAHGKMTQSLEAARLQSEERHTAVQELLQKEIGNLHTELQQMQRSIGSAITPRIILTMRVMNRGRLQASDSPISSSHRFLQTHSSAHLSTEVLDLPLRTRDQQRAFLGTLESRFPHDTTLPGLLWCHGCRMMKLTASSNRLSNQSNFEEFLPDFKSRSCCSNSICNSCLQQKIIKSLQQDWWRDLKKSRWLKCPIDGCKAPLGIRNIYDLELLLLQLQIEGTFLHRTKYLFPSPQFEPD